MNLFRLLLLVPAVGCASSVPESKDEGSTDPTTSGSIESLDDESTPEAVEEGALASVRQGPWRTESASVEGDPCGFNAYLASFGYAIEAYLPNTFVIRPSTGGFYIEASPYNVVRGPIFCTLDGTQFDCEDQAVLVSDSWLYEIEFSGEQIDEETITGTALVQFSFDDEIEADIRAAGFEMSECDHTIDMTLVYGRF